MVRINVEIGGIVQGVGFRPFVFRFARHYRLAGWVRNTARGVLLEAEGEESDVARFFEALQTDAPPLAMITSITKKNVPFIGEEGFSILSSSGGVNTIQIAPDCDVCPDCLRELFNPADRRYCYPFINCTNCGPRYSIITATPYDRDNTTMAGFAMCDDCRAEYTNPSDRRFHAQPNACQVCGPQLRLLDPGGNAIDGDPLGCAVQLLKDGRILAVKGLGGYHLAVDACNESAVVELRKRKKREEKPFALMVPGLPEAASLVWLNDTEKRLLTGPERPILLMAQRDVTPIAPQVAPANGYFGVMLPSTPLHHLLLKNNFTALVMTSGNLSDEPIACHESEAMKKLAGIADYFLVHNREIHAPCDDSVIRVFQGNPLFLRRSRGYVPRNVSLPASQRSVLAVGAELKGTICLTRGDRAFMSRHIGDLKNASTYASLKETVSHMQGLLEIVPEVVAHDLHPDYLSTAYALERLDIPHVAVQHHHAHMASCMAENGLEGDVIGVIFDGTGYGSDNTIWGGEFLLGGYQEFQRHGHFAPVRMPGGDAAVREPWRMALSYSFRTFGEQAFQLPLPFLTQLTEQDKQLLKLMLERGINSPLTSSCGRLFDAMAALIGVRGTASYEGQAAIELEALAEKVTCGVKEKYPCGIDSVNGQLVIDFQPMFRAVIQDVTAGAPCELMARRFHNTLVHGTADVCEQIASESGIRRVVLSGGVFQNRLLAEGVHQQLNIRGLKVFTHRLVPPNDGGISLGQAIITGRSTVCV